MRNAYKRKRGFRNGGLAARPIILIPTDNTQRARFEAAAGEENRTLSNFMVRCAEEYVAEHLNTPSFDRRRFRELYESQLGVLGGPRFVGEKRTGRLIMVYPRSEEQRARFAALRIMEERSLNDFMINVAVKRLGSLRAEERTGRVLPDVVELGERLLVDFENGKHIDAGYKNFDTYVGKEFKYAKSSANEAMKIVRDLLHVQEPMDRDDVRRITRQNLKQLIRLKKLGVKLTRPIIGAATQMTEKRFRAWLKNRATAGRPRLLRS